MAVSPADTNEPARVLNYLTAPHVVIWSAVSCSSAFPFLFMPQDLLARDAHGQLIKCGPALSALLLRHMSHQHSKPPLCLAVCMVMRHPKVRP